MKKALIKDLGSFRVWQHGICIEVESNGQKAVNSMPLPEKYPCIISWIFYELVDLKNRSWATFDNFEYVYVYIDSFPVKELKRGMYIYQIAKTSEGLDAWLEH